MLADVAQIESKNISERTGDGLAAVKAKGVELGRKKLDRHIHANIVDCLKAGFKAPEIAKDLNRSETTI